MAKHKITTAHEQTDELHNLQSGRVRHMNEEKPLDKWVVEGSISSLMKLYADVEHYKQEYETFVRINSRWITATII